MKIFMLEKELIRAPENPVVRGRESLSLQEPGCEIHETEIANVYPPLMLPVKMEWGVKGKCLYARGRYCLFFGRRSLGHFDFVGKSVVRARRLGQRVLPWRKPLWRAKTIRAALLWRSRLYK
jgi:hypothetical protein